MLVTSGGQEARHKYTCIVMLISIAHIVVVPCHIKAVQLFKARYMLCAVYPCPASVWRSCSACPPGGSGSGQPPTSASGHCRRARTSTRASPSVVSTISNQKLWSLGTILQLHLHDLKPFICPFNNLFALTEWISINIFAVVFYNILLNIADTIPASCCN